MPSEDKKDDKVVGADKEQPANIPSDGASDEDVKPKDETLAKVVEKVKDADSILVALSKDPSVDEIAAAIGLTISFDRMGKHATAIYSGKTPNALQFLEPEKTFEANTNSLQDFIIALDKEKADHLRYKIEGDFVKVYITPYKTTITEEDLEFYHGEVNVDMVISFNVEAQEDLDAALAKHGRIMHDAVAINISNGAPGRLGGLEWNNADASSVSEMVLKYLDAADQNIEKDVATALLTGIVAETERFSNDKTSPDTMAASAELMQKGADQQLIISHMDDMEKETKKEEEKPVEKAKNSDPGSIDVSHEDEEPTAEESASTPAESLSSESAEEPATEEATPEQQLEQMISGASTNSSASVGSDAGTDSGVKSDDISTDSTTTSSDVLGDSLMAELAQAAKENETSSPESAIVESPAPSGPSTASESSADPTILSIDKSDAPELKPDSQPTEPQSDNPAVSAAPDAPVAPEVPATPEIAQVSTGNIPVDQIYNTASDTVNMNDGVMAPVEEFEQPKDYGAMMEEALAEPLNVPAVNPAISAAPVAPVAPEVQPVTDMVSQMTANAQPMPGVEVPQMAPVSPTTQPVAPDVSPAPITQQATQPVAPTGATPEMNIPVAPTAPELPPPPAPVTGFGVMPPAAPTMPEVEPAQPIQPMPAVEAMQPTPATTPVAPIPTPAQDTSDAIGIPEAPTGVAPPPEPVNPVVVQPVPDPTSVSPVPDPGSFKIPGM